jgi:N-alpha-acetyl-L-2,4-diaminobutyrate deacetylase
VISDSLSRSIDFDGAGKQYGHLSLPAASNESAWGTLSIPVCVASNGNGPTVALISGLHGDAFVGSLALQRLAVELDISKLAGRVLILPTANPAAQAAGQRFSPIDGKNLNRCFPGRPDGSLTQRLAHLLVTDIIERADIVIDLHSGGRSMEFAPLAAVHFRADQTAQKQAEELMIAFGAPNSLRMLETSTRGMLDTEVEQRDKIFVTTELGGGGTASSTAVRSALIGCKNVLIQAGVLNADFALRMSRMLEIKSDEGYLVAPASGLLDLQVEIGSNVYRGDTIANIVDPGHVGASSVPINATFNGVLMARHHPGLIKHGDCVAVLADEVQR